MQQQSLDRYLQRTGAKSERSFAKSSEKPDRQTLASDEGSTADNNNLNKGHSLQMRHFASLDEATAADD